MAINTISKCIVSTLQSGGHFFGRHSVRIGFEDFSSPAPDAKLSPRSLLNMNMVYIITNLTFHEMNRIVFSSAIRI